MNLTLRIEDGGVTVDAQELLPPEHAHLLSEHYELSEFVLDTCPEALHATEDDPAKVFVAKYDAWIESTPGWWGYYGYEPPDSWLVAKLLTLEEVPNA